LLFGTYHDALRVELGADYILGFSPK
jgi:hypothetical protein